MSKVAADDVVLEPFRPELAKDLVRMWRESFELGVGVVDPHPIEEQEHFQRNNVAQAFYERHGFKIIARGHEPNWKLDDLKYEWRA